MTDRCAMQAEEQLLFRVRFANEVIPKVVNFCINKKLQEEVVSQKDFILS